MKGGHPKVTVQDGTQPTVFDVSQPDIFDSLSKTLSRHAAHLTGAEAIREQEVRGKVLRAIENYKLDRLELGRSLAGYKVFFKSRREWTNIVTEIGTAISLSARTMFRILVDYEHSVSSEEELAGDTDVSSLRGDVISKQERRERAARLAIRAALNNVPDTQKLHVLGYLIEEEAFQIWGCRDSFHINVNPRPSRFTIDGRKRIPNEVNEASAA